jgi:hypothetical protein
MLTYNKLKKNRRKFLALTGLTPKEFTRLLPAFERVYGRKYPSKKTRAGKARKRKAGGGRKGNLHGVEQRLLFALVYQKTYPLQALIGELFGISQSRANAWIHQLLPVLKQALANLRVLPERNPRQFARHERRKSKTITVIIDGTERRRQRPKNPKKQALHYSGKKKVHSDKNVVLVDVKTTRVGYLSQTCVGKTHDKKVAENERISYPREATLYKDTGFQGYEPRVHKTWQPKKSLTRES